MREVAVCFPFLLGSYRAGFPRVSLTLMEMSQSKHVVHLREIGLSLGHNASCESDGNVAMKRG